MARQQHRDETTDGAESGRALALRTPPPQDDASETRRSGGRPMAAFVTQLMLGADASLQVARPERTRIAAAHYARTAASLLEKPSI